MSNIVEIIEVIDQVEPGLCYEELKQRAEEIIRVREAMSRVQRLELTATETFGLVGYLIDTLVRSYGREEVWSELLTRQEALNGIETTRH